KRRGGPKAHRTPQDDQADELTNAFWERYPTAQKWIALRQAIRAALDRLPRDDVARALARLGEEHRPVSGATLQIAYSQIIAERQGRRISAQQPRRSTDERRSTTEARVEAALRLARELAEREAAQDAAPADVAVLPSTVRGEMLA